MQAGNIAGAKMWYADADERYKEHEAVLSVEDSAHFFDRLKRLSSIWRA